MSSSALTIYWLSLVTKKLIAVLMTLGYIGLTSSLVYQDAFANEVPYGSFNLTLGSAGKEASLEPINVVSSSKERTHFLCDTKIPDVYLVTSNRWKNSKFGRTCRLNNCCNKACV